MDTVKDTEGEKFVLSEHSMKLLKTLTGSTNHALTVRHLNCEQEEETGSIYRMSQTNFPVFQMIPTKRGHILGHIV